MKQRRHDTVASICSLLAACTRKLLWPEFNASVPAGKYGGVNVISASPEIGRPRKRPRSSRELQRRVRPLLGHLALRGKLETQAAGPFDRERAGIEVLPARIDDPRELRFRFTLPVAASRPCFCTISNCCSSTSSGVPRTCKAMSAPVSAAPERELALGVVQLRIAVEIQLAVRVQLLSDPRRRHDDIAPARLRFTGPRLFGELNICVGRQLTGRRADAQQAFSFNRSSAASEAHRLQLQRLIVDHQSTGHDAMLSVPSPRSDAARLCKLESGINSSRGSKRGTSSCNCQVRSFACAIFAFNCASNGEESLLPRTRRNRSPETTSVPANVCSPAVQRNCPLPSPMYALRCADAPGELHKSLRRLHIQCFYGQRLFGPAPRELSARDFDQAWPRDCVLSRLCARNESTAISMGGCRVNGLEGSSGGGSVGSVISTSMPLMSRLFT